MAQIPVTITDAIDLFESSAAVRGSEVAIDDVLVVSNRLGVKARPRATLRDVVAFHDATRLTGTFGVQLFNRIRMSGRVTAAQPVAVRDRLKIRAVLRAAQAAHLRDTVQLTPHLGAVSTFLGALRDRLRLTDKGARVALGGLLRDRLRISSSATIRNGILARLRDMLRLTDHLEPRLLLHVALLENVEFEDVFDGVASVIAAHLADRVVLSIDVVSPSGDATTWAMNTRTGAVTEYLNYAFRSFARSGRGTHLAAGPDGLYELVGEDDAGDAVIADIAGGLMDFGGTFLSGMQAAYLGIRGKGQFYLRLTAGDGKTYLYSVQGRDLQQARVNVGKGLRSRYFTYELVSTGQDFDLTEITFLPVTFSRRL